MISEFGLSASEGRTLASDPSLDLLFETIRVGHANPAGIARLLVHDLRAELKGRGNPEIACSPEALGELVNLVDSGALSAGAARKVLAVLVGSGGSPAALVEELGLQQVTDTGELAALVDEVLAAHPEELARYREGEQRLQGFFVGQVMRASRGKADPKAVSALLRERLAD